MFFHYVESGESDGYFGYVPPWTIDRIREEYGNEVAERLSKDPIHSFRAETGIELIHKEPTLKELKRIWANWNKMSPEMKRASDSKSMDLFGMTNEEHYEKLLPSYEDDGSLLENLIGFIDENIRYGSPFIPKRPNGNTYFEDYDRYYKHLSPEEYEEYGMGICWDTTRYLASKLKESRIPYKALFYFYPDYSTHSIIVPYCHGKWWAMDPGYKGSGWKGFVKGFDDYEDAVRFNNRENPTQGMKAITSIEYDPLDPKTLGMNGLQFERYLIRKHRLPLKWR